MLSEEGDMLKRLQDEGVGIEKCRQITVNLLKQWIQIKKKQYGSQVDLSKLPSAPKRTDFMKFALELLNELEVINSN